MGDDRAGAKEEEMNWFYHCRGLCRYRSCLQLGGDKRRREGGKEREDGE